MHVEKVKYVLWVADWQRCLKFYRELFDGVVSFDSEVWSEIITSDQSAHLVKSGTHDGHLTACKVAAVSLA